MEMINKKNAHKLWLDIKLIGECKVKIKLLMVSSNIPKHPYEPPTVFRDKRTGIVIWSYSSFTFDDRQLRIPQIDKLSNNMEHVHEFDNKTDRYVFLKNLSRTLNNWSRDVQSFPTNFTYGKYNSLTMTDNFWIVN